MSQCVLEVNFLSNQTAVNCKSMRRWVFNSLCRVCLVTIYLFGQAYTAFGHQYLILLNTCLSVQLALWAVITLPLLIYTIIDSQYYFTGKQLLATVYCKWRPHRVIHYSTEHSNVTIHSSPHLLLLQWNYLWSALIAAYVMPFNLKKLHLQMKERYSSVKHSTLIWFSNWVVWSVSVQWGTKWFAR